MVQVLLDYLLKLALPVGVLRLSSFVVVWSEPWAPRSVS